MASTDDRPATLFRRAYDHVAKSFGIEVRLPADVTDSEPGSPPLPSDCRAARPVLLAAVADLHANSSVALCPADGIDLDDGGHYDPSRHQVWLWHRWLDFWGRVRARRDALGADLVVLVNGDMVEGDHHRTAQLVSRNLETQHRLALAIMQPVLDLAPREVYVVRGTEAHVGSSAEREEALARELEAVVVPGSGVRAHGLLRVQLASTLVHAHHHAGIGRLPWTRHNMANRLAHEVLISAASRHERWPDLVLTAHNHTLAESAPGPVRVVQMPCWQLSTMYGQRVAPGKMPSIGGVMAVCRPGMQAPEVDVVTYSADLPDVIVSSAGR